MAPQLIVMDTEGSDAIGCTQLLTSERRSKPTLEGQGQTVVVLNRYGPSDGHPRLLTRRAAQLSQQQVLQVQLPGGLQLYSNYATNHPLLQVHSGASGHVGMDVDALPLHLVV